MTKQKYNFLFIKAYIIDRKWVRKWKDFVDYNQVKFSFHLEGKYEPKPNSFPGPISNLNIITPMEKFLNDGDTTNPDNLVIRNGLDLRSDVRLINKSMWEFFVKLYGGGPEVIKKVIEDKSSSYSYSSKVIEVFFRKLNIIYLPLRKDISEASIEKITDNVVYISRNKSLKELKEKLAFLYNKNLDNLELTSTNIRLWKLKPNSVSSEIKKDLLENIKEIQDQENFFKAIDFKDLFQYLECNNNF